MASSNRNLLTHSYSGKIGDQFVFRNVGDQSVMAAKPKRRRRASKSETEQSQEAIRERFKKATIYAKSAMADPTLKAEYTSIPRGAVNPFRTAFMDKMKPPVLSELKLAGYDGQPGQLISVEAVDDVRVTWVKFALHAADGTKLEEGDAVLDVNGLQWNYTTQVVNPGLAGTRLTITASDLPKNVTLLEKVL